MSEHIIDLDWENEPNPVATNTFTRNHQVSLSGGQQVQVSASPDFKGDPACADPEQLLVSALSSCHMLTFLAIAELKGFKVNRYSDRATGFLEKGEGKRPTVTRIQLQPQIEFEGDKVPDAQQLEHMHQSAHKNCFIANSITAKVDVLAT